MTDQSDEFAGATPGQSADDKVREETGYWPAEIASLMIILARSADRYQNSHSETASLARNASCAIAELLAENAALKAQVEKLRKCVEADRDCLLSNNAVLEAARNDVREARAELEYADGQIRRLKAQVGELEAQVEEHDKLILSDAQAMTVEARENEKITTEFQETVTADRDRLQAELDGVRAVAGKLANEVMALQFKEGDLRHIVGDTNFNCLMARAEEARTALSANAESREPATEKNNG